MRYRRIQGLLTGTKKWPRSMLTMFFRRKFLTNKPQDLPLCWPRRSLCTLKNSSMLLFWWKLHHLRLWVEIPWLSLNASINPTSSQDHAIGSQRARNSFPQRHGQRRCFSRRTQGAPRSGSKSRLMTLASNSGVEGVRGGAARTPLMRR